MPKRASPSTGGRISKNPDYPGFAMPTYEYICEKCGHRFDFNQSMASEALKVCPKEACQKTKWGKGKVKRQIGAGAGLIFKGSGFYITDYRSEGYKSSAKKDTEATKAPAADAKTAPKTDAKPATPATPAAPAKPAASSGPKT
jgi:putative FmdB family regulatory protein